MEPQQSHTPIFTLRFTPSPTPESRRAGRIVLERTPEPFSDDHETVAIANVWRDDDGMRRIDAWTSVVENTITGQMLPCPVHRLDRKKISAAIRTPNTRFTLEHPTRLETDEAPE